MTATLSRLLPAGLLLALAACPPTYPKCESDSHCQEKGEVCVQGQCQECATDVQCKSGFVCEANRCVPKPECVASTDCGTGKKCQSGKCVTHECDDDAGCGPGKKCQANRCVVPPCASNADCAPGEQCRAGTCAAMPPPVDTRSSQCEYGAVRFGFNEYSLDAESRTRLSEIADCMQKENRAVVLEGHADERGTEEYNLQLSNKRAASVKRYLVDLGVRDGLLDAVGFGENRPVSDAQSEEGWAQNRRVEFNRK